MTYFFGDVNVAVCAKFVWGIAVLRIPQCFPLQTQASKANRSKKFKSLNS